jgi:Flp pilus assembly protein TadD
MNWNAKTFAAHGLSLTALFSIVTIARAQNSVTLAQAPSAVIVLDSTKAQDGLNGSVRRVKTESAKLEFKKGQIVEGPRQLIEITTYDVSGKRVENISYPVTSSSVGKEEYKYDDRGNIIEMTMRGDGGSILSREAYNYEFDRFGNWTKMVTNLVVFESEELKREPVEVTYRSFTYYFDDSVAKITDSPAHGGTPAIPPPSGPQIGLQGVENGLYQLASGDLSPSIPVAAGDLSSVHVDVGEPPPEVHKAPTVEKASSAVSADSQTNQPAKDTSTDIAESSPIPFDSQPAREEAYISVNPGVREAETMASPAHTSSGDSGETARAENNPTKVVAAVVTADKQAFELYKNGRDLFDSGDAKGAIGSYLQSIDLEPKSAEVQLSLGQAYLKLKKDKDASKAFKESLRLNPNSAEAQYGLGLAAFRMGRHRDAADAFKRAIQISPDLAKAHYGLALAYQELEDVKGVIEEYRLLERLDRELAKQLARAFPVFDLPCHVGPSCK